MKLVTIDLDDSRSHRVEICSVPINNLEPGIDVSVIGSYFRDMHICIAVFSLFDRETFERLPLYIKTY